MRRLLELITGQNNLNYVQSKIYPGEISELCRFCEEEEETFEHLINECPCFITYRRDILKNRPIKDPQLESKDTFRIFVHTSN